jgi:hypothetical protein
MHSTKYIKSSKSVTKFILKYSIKREYEIGNKREIRETTNSDEHQQQQNNGRHNIAVTLQSSQGFYLFTVFHCTQFREKQLQNRTGIKLKQTFPLSFQTTTHPLTDSRTQSTQTLPHSFHQFRFPPILCSFN